MCYFLSIITPGASRALLQLQEHHEVEVQIAHLHAPLAQRRYSVVHLITHRGCSCGLIASGKAAATAEWQRRLRAALRIAVTRSTTEFGSVLVAVSRTSQQALSPSRAIGKGRKFAASQLRDEAWLVPGEVIEVFAKEVPAGAAQAEASIPRSKQSASAAAVRKRPTSWARN